MKITRYFLFLFLVLSSLFLGVSFAEKPPHHSQLGPIASAGVYDTSGTLAGMFAALYGYLDSTGSAAEKRDIERLISSFDFGLRIYGSGDRLADLAAPAFWGSFVAEGGEHDGETIFFAAAIVGDTLMVGVSGADGAVRGAVSIKLGNQSIDQIFNAIVSGLSVQNGMGTEIAEEVARRVTWWLIMRYPNRYAVWHFKDTSGSSSFSNVSLNKKASKALFNAFKKSGLLNNRNAFEAELKQAFEVHFNQPN